MNMKSNESKEMLMDSNGVRLIDYHIDLIKSFDMEPVVISRPEKQDLISHISGRTKTILIEPSGEWPETILASENFWGSRNIMVLPDTRFSPTTILADIEKSLSLGCSGVIAVHEVSDPDKWCVVDDYRLIEKPVSSKAKYAMGVIGFSKVYGQRLFTAISKRNTKFELQDTGFLFLDEFKDLTRTGKIENAF